MATSFTFNNQVVELPGSYSQFVSGVTNPPLSLSYGNVLLVDSGMNSGYGAGAGINGQLAEKKNAIYQATTLGEFRRAIGGGILWDIAGKLFQPNGPGGGNGVSKLFYVRAGATVPAEVTIGLENGSNGGTLTVQARNEGFVGNGVEGDQILSKTTATPFTVTAAGTSGDTHSIEITDLDSSTVEIGSYTLQASETESDVATALADSINSGTSGFTAKANGATIVVSSRNPQGQELATDFDGLVSAYNVTGTATGTAGVFAGAVDGTVLTRGYSVTMSTGVDDPAKYVLQFFRGTYRGEDENGFTWDGRDEISTTPDLILVTPEFENIQEVHTWMEKNTTFGSHFKLKSKTVVGDGSIDPADLVANADNNLFSGGTETFSQADLDLVLESIQDLDFSLVLATDYGAEAKSTSNGKILAHIADGSTFGDKMMVIGAGEDSDTFTGTPDSSIEVAQYYNNDRVIVCHGGPTKTSTQTSTGMIDQTSLHKAAVVCGRLAGLEPQIPITFKTLKIDGERHKLSLKEQKKGLKAGVLMSIHDGSMIRVVQGVNSIQDNDFLVNSDASTHSIQLRRMIAQVNKEIVVNANEQLLKKPDGTNRHTLSASDVKTFTEGYLKRRTVTTTQDNMIISFRNVVVTLDNDAYKVSYDVIFNTEITKLFFTGTVFLNFN